MPGLVFLACLQAAEPSSWDVGEVEMGRKFTRRFAVPGERVRRIVTSCACFTSRLLEDGTAEIDLDTSTLIGANRKPITLFLDDAGRRFASVAVRFDVVSTRVVDKPELSLVYAPDAPPEALLRFYELAQKRGATFEVRAVDRLSPPPAIDGLRLRDGEKTWSGTAPVMKAIAALRRAAGIIEPGTPPPSLPRGTGSGPTVYFFYSRGCAECVGMLERELPAVVARREGASLVPLDIVEPENLQRLVGVMQVHRSREGNLPVAVVGDRYLAGIDRVRRELPDAVMSARTTGAPAPGDLRAAFGAITIGAVILAGLVDGLNPCAFATAVFLASFLAARRRPTFDVVVAGALFTSAVFATYLAIGYGLAHLATALTAAAVSWATAAIALVFAALSVRDAVVYARTGEASKVAVRLPDAVKARVHGAIGGMRVAIYGGALAAGVIVTLLEAVCTGQIYVPVIVAMTRESARAHGLLVLYNLAFVLPLVGVLGFAVAGTKWTRMAEWSKRNVVAAKVMMAAVLVAMAGYLVWR